MLDLARFRKLEEEIAITDGNVAVKKGVLVISLADIPTYADESAAEVAVLPAGTLYRVTGSGTLNIKEENS